MSRTASRWPGRARPRRRRSSWGRCAPTRRRRRAGALPPPGPRRSGRRHRQQAAPAEWLRSAARDRTGPRTALSMPACRAGDGGAAGDVAICGAAGVGRPEQYPLGVGAVLRARTAAVGSWLGLHDGAVCAQPVGGQGAAGRGERGGGVGERVPAGVAVEGGELTQDGEGPVARVQRRRSAGGPRAGRQHRPTGHRCGLAGQHGSGQATSVLGSGTGAAQQRPGRDDVGVGRRRVVEHPSLGVRVKRQQRVRALQVRPGPSPYPVERNGVAGGHCQRQRIGLTFADGVASLVLARDPAVGLYVAGEPGDGAGHRWRGCAVPVETASRQCHCERNRQHAGPAGLTGSPAPQGGAL